ncbi:MAG: cyclic nucleotide-binding domain-containing protein [Candidatus Hydrogenedentes bacterium]|nr:cyclic nucleotide-binding domain-containing protein [Candidatus Hydrogenedentota bacterium]
MQNIDQILADHPFMKGLDAFHIAQLAEMASTATFSASQYIFRSGDFADRCYLLRQGHVAVEIFDARRGPIIVETIGEPNVIGWSWLVEPYNWCFDARAVELTRAVVLDAAQLRNACENDHRFGFEILKRFTQVFAQRLHAARFQLLDVYGANG